MSDRKGEAFNIIKAINEVSLLVSICNKREMDLLDGEYPRPWYGILKIYVFFFNHEHFGFQPWTYLYICYCVYVYVSMCMHTHI